MIQRKDLEDLGLYSDPAGKVLREKLGALYGLKSENIFLSNGSDDILNFAFMAFAGNGVEAQFADITYSFYPVFANLNGVTYRTAPVGGDFGIKAQVYINCKRFVGLSNPNAPPGMAILVRETAAGLASNQKHAVGLEGATVGLVDI